MRYSRYEDDAISESLVLETYIRNMEERPRKLFPDLKSPLRNIKDRSAGRWLSNDPGLA